MPNLASVLKDEILRLARKEVRSEVEGIRKASTKYRSEIAGLKRDLLALEKRLGRIESGKATKTGSASKTGNSEEGEASPRRFSAKGLVSLRKRLGLSASEAGQLVGASAQTIYNWETGKAKPRSGALQALAALRRMGKREIKAKLAQPKTE